jgi:hypothetical protein
MRLLIPLLFALTIAPDLSERLAKWKPVRMPYDSSGLSAREKQVVDKLVQASRFLEQIYWQQSDPEALELYKTTKDARLKRFLLINGCRYDLIAENKPFVGTEPMPPGRNLYPKDLTRERIEEYVKKHPEQRDSIYDPYTVIRRDGDRLKTIPYHVEYKQWLEPAARLLREAADASDDKAFANFLLLRADALVTDDYYPSDLAWVDLNNPKIDVIFAPYETYLDDVLAVKTSYGTSLLIRNEQESKNLELYQKYVPDIQDALPLAAEDRPSKRGQPTPMEVSDAPHRGGDLRHGYQAVADNLPNDPRIHQAKGTKKIFFKNFMDARVNYVILPLARYMMPADQAAKASAAGYMAGTVMHEICHGLGPAYSRVNGKQVDIREALGPVYSGLEEAKADVTGMFGLKWLMDHGALSKDRLQEYYASYIAGIFRTVRYGTGEAHGRAEMMEFNYLLEQRAIANIGGKYSIDYDRIPGVVAELAKELLMMEATGDRARAEAWFKKYDQMPASLTAALKAAKGVPVDVDPIFSLPDF